MARRTSLNGLCEILAVCSILGTRRGEAVSIGAVMGGLHGD